MVVALISNHALHFHIFNIGLRMTKFIVAGIFKIPLVTAISEINEFHYYECHWLLLAKPGDDGPCQHQISLKMRYNNIGQCQIVH